mmetsp:Transcript_38416/g.94467  ORF Transcript_38416/g.94467 Transcript_38416/m.94467 type:complete len:220 (+) Transcript_38416:35-694(+)
MRLLAAALLLCLAKSGTCQQTCRSATTQAGSRADYPCAGTVYRTKLCADTDESAAQLADFIGDLADTTFTAESCRNDIITPQCLQIGHNGVAKPGANCAIMCEVLQTGAAILCDADSECTSGQSISAELLMGGVDTYISTSIAKMCCSYYEAKIRESCDGLTDAEITTFMDSATAGTCSTLPTCLDPANFSLSSRTHSWGVTALLAVGALSTLMALLLY